jgi:hypothetical protein
VQKYGNVKTPLSYPILPPVNLIPKSISGYLSLSINDLSDLAFPLFAFTSIGISLEAVLTIVEKTIFSQKKGE